MGTALTGLGVGSTYNGLLKTTDNAVLDGTLRVITDGFGNSSALQVSTAGVASSGTLSVTGASTLAALSATTGAFSSTLSVAGAISGAGFTALFASPPAIGGTAPAAGTFTTLSATASADTIIGIETGTGDGRGVVSAVVSANGNAGFTWRTNGVNRWTMDTAGTSDSESVRIRKLGTGAGAVATFSSTGLAVTGALSATGNINVGVNLGFNGGVNEAIAYSASAIKTYIGGNPITAVSSTGLAVTGVGTFSGNLTSTGVLTLGSGPTTVSDSAGKILSAALNTVAIAQGGTGSTNASAARTALGVAIGSDVQAYSSVLATYAGITPSANVQTLLGSASFSAFRTSLGVAIGTDVQAYNAGLASLAGLSTTNKLYYLSAANTWSAVTIGSNLTFSGGTLSAASGGGGTIGGSTGATDNRLIRADGTGGSTVQSSGITIDDSDNVTGAATMDVGTGGYKVSGTKVLGAQQAAESDIALLTAIGGFDQVDATDVAANFGDLNSKINSILAKLRAHGIIAT